MNMSSKLRTLLSAAALVLAFASEGECKKPKLIEPGESQVVLDLNDGSRIIGKPGVEKISLRTSFGQVDIPLSQIEEIACSGDKESVAVRLQDGDRLSGFLTFTALRIHTVIGVVTVPMEQVSRISVRASGAGVWGGTFDGIECGISIPPHTLARCDTPASSIEQFPQPLRSCTWMFWMRTRQPTGGSILFKADPRNERHFYAGINDTDPNRPGKFTWVERSRGGDFKWATRATVTDGRWHHIALVRNMEDNSLRFCVDGAWEPAGTNPGMWEIFNERPLLVGEDYQGRSRFCGELRDLRYYSVALSTEEIRRVGKGDPVGRDCYVVPLRERTSLPAFER